MSRTKKWIIAGVIMIFAGALISTGAFAYSGFNLNMLGTASYVTNTYEADEEFKNIRIEEDAGGIVFALSDDDKVKVECIELEKAPHDVSVKNGTLYIKEASVRMSPWEIGFPMGKIRTTILLPEKEYEELSIESDLGSIDIPKDFIFRNIKIDHDAGGLKCLASVKEDIHINTDVGKTELEGLTCKNLIVGSDTGAISLTDVKASGRFDLKTDVGSITFDACDAEEIKAETATGSIEGTFLSDKVFSAKTDTGRVDVPDTREGGRCELATDTGSISIKIVKK